MTIKRKGKGALIDRGAHRENSPCPVGLEFTPSCDLIFISLVNFSRAILNNMGNNESPSPDLTCTYYSDFIIPILIFIKVSLMIDLIKCINVGG